MKIRAYAAKAPGARLEPFEYEVPELGPDQVEIKVLYCGICRSDLNMIQNDWEMSSYPLVPGHEVLGTIAALGENVRNLELGQKVGLGWFSKSCMACPECLSGAQNLCHSVEQTIVGRFGGFAEKVRAHWSWVIPFPVT